jgi:hypothetical protein
MNKPNCQENAMNATTTYATRVRDAHLGLNYCPECDRPAFLIAGNPEEAAVHTLGHGLVIVGCEGYWTVDPALVGLERGGWTNTDGETPKPTLPARVIAWDREETDTCEAGTPGCSINHKLDQGDGCDTW